MTKILTSFLLTLLFLAGCGPDYDPQDKAAFDTATAADTGRAYRMYLSVWPDGAFSEEAARLAADRAVAVTNANNVIVDDGTGLNVRMMGELIFPLGQGGVFTGQLGRPQPAGPVIVYIFREISESYAKQLTEIEILAESNTAYVFSGGAAYSAEAIRNAEYVGSIDPTKSDDELAAAFGLDTD